MAALGRSRQTSADLGCPTLTLLTQDLSPNQVWTLGRTQQLSLERVTVANSRASLGGGVAVAHSSCTIASAGGVVLNVRDAVFLNNAASTHSGGALALSSSDSVADSLSWVENAAVISASNFTGNYAADFAGAIFATDAFWFEISESVFEDNKAGDAGGGALGINGADMVPRPTVSSSSFARNTPDSIYTQSPVAWVCDPGQYMAQVGIVTADFDGCLPCFPGYFGRASTLTTPQCDAICPKGHFCPEGTSEPLACEPGTHLPSVGAASIESCIGCAPGSYSDLPGNSNTSCLSCPPGTFSEAMGSVSCDPCQLGGYCASAGQASALMSWTACPAGTMGDATGLTSATQCISCPKGHYCLEGRRGVAPEPSKCRENTFQDRLNAEDNDWCLSCPANAVSPKASTSFDACLCKAGFYVVGVHPNASCVPCPLPGSACEAPGTTLATIPLEHGYWRPSLISTDVRPCKDFHGTDPGASGCGGGVSLCKTERGLSGVY